MTELRYRAENSDNKPDIIMITEVKPKRNRYKITEQELSIDGYDIHSDIITKSTGRGTLIYAKKRAQNI